LEKDPNWKAWLPAQRASVPFYPSFGLQSTAADLSQLMSYIVWNFTEEFNMMKESSDVKTDDGVIVTNGGAYLRTLTDGTTAVCYDAHASFNNKTILEFSLGATIWYSLQQNLAASVVVNTYTDINIEGFFNTVIAASLIQNYGFRRNCQSYISKAICEEATDCKWITPVSAQSSGGVCVKSVAVPVKLQNPYVNLQELNIRKN